MNRCVGDRIRIIHAEVALRYARYGGHGCGVAGSGGARPRHVRAGGCYEFYGSRALRGRAGWLLSGKDKVVNRGAGARGGD